MTATQTNSRLPREPKEASKAILASTLLRRHVVDTTKLGCLQAPDDCPQSQLPSGQIKKSQ